MRLPDMYGCDWPECERTDITKVGITYDGEPKVNLDLCPQHSEPLGVFLDLGARPSPSRTAQVLDQFLRDE